MPDFAYIARDTTGKKVSGLLTAPSRRDVVATLGKQSLFPLEVKDAQAGAAVAQVRRGRKVRPQVMAVVYAQLADLLRSGVPLLRALEVVKNQSSQAALKEVMAEVYSAVEDGTNIADAMQANSRAFSEMAISMVRAGAEGGFLEDALARVAQFTEQQQDLKSRTSGALAYPAFLAVVGVAVVLVLVVFFVPRFETLFARLRDRGELPALTDILLWVSHTLGHWGWLVLIVFVGVGAFVRKRLSTEAGRIWSDRLKLRLPGIGRIFQNLAVARFCRVLGTLLHNGVPILRSLEISSAAAGNRVLEAAIKEAAENISAGQSLAKPLGASGYFPPEVVEMIAVAEESNTLEGVLTNISDSLEKRTFRRLDLIVRLLEPLMLLVMAGMVLLVVIALLMPVLKMSTTM
ncbi:MAG TPA: type II secretion system F family protein [Pirellulales bacterium]|jgi:general secretion pathway protein F/type IV pilus assembly protein PilC|nr:type II secretion system F family protein [Pirellulales bacterium]